MGRGDREPSQPFSHRGLGQPREEPGTGAGVGSGSLPEEAGKCGMEWGLQPETRQEMPDLA